MFVQTVLMAVVVLGMATVASGAQGEEEVDWGAWRVEVQERWPGAEAGWGDASPGIGLWRRLTL